MLSLLCIVIFFYLGLFLPSKREQKILKKEHVAKPSMLAGELGKKKRF